MARSGIFIRTGSDRIAMLQVHEAVSGRNGQGFFAVVTQKLLTMLPVLNGVGGAGTQENGSGQQKRLEKHHPAHPSWSRDLRSMMAALARAM